MWPLRSVLRCSAIFYIMYIGHGFDGNGSAQRIFASMFCHSDVCLRHQISGTKGLNQCIKCPVEVEDPECANGGGVSHILAEKGVLASLY